MADSRATEALLRDTLLQGIEGEPIAALRSLARRRRRRRAGRLAVVAMIAGALLSPLFRPARESAMDGETFPKSWVVETRPLAPEEIVSGLASIAPEVVISHEAIPKEWIVHTRPGLFEPLSEEGLLVLLADRPPVLMGSPGERWAILPEGPGEVGYY